MVFIGILGGSLQANVGKQLGYDYLLFTFTGIFAETLFQSTAFGLISLIEDRENDFSQEIFISPISRYSIIFGKILGESLVAITQVIAVIGFGIVIHVPFTPERIVGLILVGTVVCLLGGAFGLLLLSGFGSQRAANQILAIRDPPTVLSRWCLHSHSEIADLPRYSFTHLAPALCGGPDTRHFLSWTSRLREGGIAWCGDRVACKSRHYWGTLHYFFGDWYNLICEE